MRQNSLLFPHKNHKPCSLYNLFPFLHAILFINSMHIWSDYVRQPYHRLHFWHTLAFFRSFLVIQVNEQYWRDEGAWIQECIDMFYTLLNMCCSKRGWVSERCRPTATSPTQIPQHDLGCQECLCLGCHFILSHVREKYIYFKNWSQSDPGCCQYSHVKLQLQESGIIIVVSAAECACH